MIGIRELRQQASAVLRRVERGEIFEITDRGRPVALLTPLAEGSVFDQLCASGEVEIASGDLAELPEPLVLEPGAEPPSQVLRRLRVDER